MTAETMKDEIPGLLDFFAASAASGQPVPDDKQYFEEWAGHIAEWSYVLARALYSEKHNLTTKH